MAHQNHSHVQATADDSGASFHSDVDKYMVIEKTIVFEYLWCLEQVEACNSQELNRSMDGTGLPEGVIIYIGLSVHFANIKCYKMCILLSIG